MIHDAALKPSGLLVLSIPNVANFTVRKQLFLGRFNYTDHGLLDRTHLHFFTADSLRQTLTRSGFEIKNWRVTADTFPLDRWLLPIPVIAATKRALNRGLRRWAPNLVAFQFVVAAARLPATESASD